MTHPHVHIPTIKLLDRYDPMIVKARRGTFESGQQDYHRSLRSSVYGLWRGQIDLFNFVDSMISGIQRGYTRAFYDGLAVCGVRPDEISAEEQAALDDEINTEIQYVVKIGNDVMQGNQDSGGKLRDLTNRLPMWENRYAAVYYLAQTLACGDRKLMWIWNPLKEHCSDCGVLNGRVYRASVWQRYQIFPRMRDLACGGFKCGCILQETDGRATPGRPPMLSRGV